MQNKSQNTPAEPERIDDLKLLAAQALEYLKKPYKPRIITEHFETHYPNPNITFDVEFDYCGDDKEYEEEIQRFYDYLEHDPDYKDRLEAEALLKYYFPEYRDENKLLELMELRKKLNITGRIEHSNKEYERVRDYAYKMNEIKARKQLSESESETTPAAKTNETTEPVKTAEPCATPPAEQKRKINRCDVSQASVAELLLAEGYFNKEDRKIAEYHDCDGYKKRVGSIIKTIQRWENGEHTPNWYTHDFRTFDFKQVRQVIRKEASIKRSSRPKTSGKY